MRNPRMLFPFTTLPLLGHMKRDFYLANEVLKKIYLQGHHQVKKKVLFELHQKYCT